MTNDVTDLLVGETMDVCTFGNGAVGALDEFLDELETETRESLLAILNRISKHGVLENGEIFRPVAGHVGLFDIAFDNVHLLCFRSGRRIVICEQLQGAVAPETFKRVSWRHGDFLRSVSEPSTQAK